VWRVLSAFIQEEKLLVAASGAMVVLPQEIPFIDVACPKQPSKTQQAELKKLLRSKI